MPLNPQHLAALLLLSLHGRQYVEIERVPGDTTTPDDLAPAWLAFEAGGVLGDQTGRPWKGIRIRFEGRTIELPLAGLKNALRGLDSA